MKIHANSLFILLLFLSIPFGIYSQNTGFLKVADEGLIIQVKKVSTGGYITAGKAIGNEFPQIIKWDEAYNRVWSYTYDDTIISWQKAKVIEANDGSFFFLTETTNNTTSAVVTKFSATGDFLWHKNYYNELFDFKIEAFCKATGGDNGFVLGASKCGLEHGLIKCNSDGIINWQKSYGLIGRLKDIIEDNDNYIAISMYSNDISGENYLKMQRIDSTCNIITSTQWNIGTSFDLIKVVKLVNIGGYAVLGKYDNSNYFVAIYYQLLNIQSHNTFISSIQFHLHDIVAINNGSNIFVIGDIDLSNYNCYNGLVINLSANGVLLWKKSMAPTIPALYGSIIFNSIVDMDNTLLLSASGAEGLAFGVIDYFGNGLCNNFDFDLGNNYMLDTSSNSSFLNTPISILSVPISFSYSTELDTTRVNICGDLLSNESVCCYNKFKIQPNPVIDELKVRGITAFPAKLSVFSTNGCKIQEIIIHQDDIIIDVSNLNKGHYLLELIDSKMNREVKSFIKL